MATDVSSVPINGNFASHSGYGSSDQNHSAYANNNSTSQSAYGNAAPSTTSNTTSQSNSASEIPKDEVGWYFVEQYYTTLSRSPEKLYVSGR